MRPPTDKQVPRDERSFGGRGHRSLASLQDGIFRPVLPVSRQHFDRPTALSVSPASMVPAAWEREGVHLA